MKLGRAEGRLIYLQCLNGGRNKEICGKILHHPWSTSLLVFNSPLHKRLNSSRIIDGFCQHSEGVLSVAVSKDGKYAFSSSSSAEGLVEDKIIKTDLKTGEVLAEVNLTARHLGVAPNSNYVVACRRAEFELCRRLRRLEGRCACIKH